VVEDGPRNGGTKSAPVPENIETLKSSPEKEADVSTTKKRTWPLVMVRGLANAEKVSRTQTTRVVKRRSIRHLLARLGCA